MTVTGRRVNATRRLRFSFFYQSHENINFRLPLGMFYRFICVLRNEKKFYNVIYTSCIDLITRARQRQRTTRLDFTRVRDDVIEMKRPKREF